MCVVSMNWNTEVNSLDQRYTASERNEHTTPTLAGDPRGEAGSVSWGSQSGVQKEAFREERASEQAETGRWDSANR